LLFKDSLLLVRSRTLQLQEQNMQFLNCRVPEVGLEEPLEQQDKQELHPVELVVLILNF
jgi:hypothetical protein